jgi:hypothetical protein
MELVTTYSPSGKTKYFGVALDTGEVLAARTKKAALHIIETLQKYVKNATRNAVSQEPIVVDSTIDSDNNSIEHVSHADGGAAKDSVSPKRIDHPTVVNVKTKYDFIHRRLAEEVSDHVISIEEHGRRAEEHGRRAEEWGKAIDEIQKMRDEFLSALSDDSRYFGVWDEENQLPQQLNHERPQRRITQVNLDQFGGDD